jgi:hypothetical protein
MVIIAAPVWRAGAAFASTFGRDDIRFISARSSD